MSALIRFWCERMGKSPHLVHVVNGLPARPAFLVPVDSHEALLKVDHFVTEELKQKFSKASFSWPYAGSSVLESARDPSIPLLVIMGGGEGMGIQKIIDFLPHWRPTQKINVMIIAGRSESLFNDLVQLVHGKNLHPNLNLVPLGFTEQIADIYQAATLLISKPGGSTLAESEATGVPLFVHTFIPGQESENLIINEKMGTAQVLDLGDLNEVDALIVRSVEIRKANSIHFSGAKMVPAMIANAIEDYVRTRFSQQPEQREMEARMARSSLSWVQRGCLRQLTLPRK